METPEEIVKAFKELREHDKRLEKRVLVANLVFAFVVLVGIFNVSSVSFFPCR